MRALRFTHRWLGLLLALPLLLQGLTGAVLALTPALDWIGQTGAPAEVGSADAIVAAALAAGPPGARASRYEPPDSAGAPARVMLLPAGQRRGPGLVVLVDPATTTALGPAASEAGALFWIKRLHENWLVPQWGGRQFAGWLGVGLLALVLLGLPLWWPPVGGWRVAFTVPRGARGARLQRALHGAMGGWCALLLLVTGATGVTQGFPQTFRATIGAGTAQRFSPGGPNDAAPRAQPGLDAAIAAAKHAAPGLVLRLVMLSPGPEPIRLVLGPPGSTGATTSTVATFDPRHAVGITLQSPEQRAAPERFLGLMRDLHAGDGFGSLWRGLASLSGVLLPGFGITGFLLWWLKRRNRRRARSRVAWQPAEGEDAVGIQ